jgi:hypothetical protein
MNYGGIVIDHRERERNNSPTPAIGEGDTRQLLD